jgi:hypothetical protein
MRFVRIDRAVGEISETELQDLAYQLFNAIQKDREGTASEENRTSTRNGYRGSLPRRRRGSGPES